MPILTKWSVKINFLTMVQPPVLSMHNVEWGRGGETQFIIRMIIIQNCVFCFVFIHKRQSQVSKKSCVPEKWRTVDGDGVQWGMAKVSLPGHMHPVLVLDFIHVSICCSSDSFSFSSVTQIISERRGLRRFRAHRVSVCTFAYLSSVSVV